MNAFCIWLVVLYLQVRLAATAPASTSAEGSQSTPSPTSSSNIVGYVADPSGRGTTSLVLSCLLTLFLCVWSALHLNVPAQSENQCRRILRNLRWIIIGIYAPELVVFTAWRQYASANLLGDVINCLDRDTSKAALSSFGTQGKLPARTRSFPTPGRRHVWTRTHGFFASTGGFAFDVKSQHSTGAPQNARGFLPADLPRRLTLTARGVALLARCGHLPDVSEEDIRDKSKANNLAKALVLFQTLWMLIQTIERLMAKLPVTLLEVNTIAHV